jgi:ethanolamine utilization protein EutQ (cupin superfamily)
VFLTQGSNSVFDRGIKLLKRSHRGGNADDKTQIVMDLQENQTMKKILCTFAVSTVVALSGLAFADIQKWEKKDISDKKIKVNGDLGLPGIYLWNVTSQNDAPLTCGLYIMQRGDAVAAGTISKTDPLTLDYTYTYDESKVILGGNMTVLVLPRSHGHSVKSSFLWLS